MMVGVDLNEAMGFSTGFLAGSRAAEEVVHEAEVAVSNPLPAVETSPVEPAVTAPVPVVEPAPPVPLRVERAAKSTRH